MLLHNINTVKFWGAIPSGFEVLVGRFTAVLGEVGLIVMLWSVCAPVFFEIHAITTVEIIK